MQLGKKSKTIANNRTSMKMSNNLFGKQSRTEMRSPSNKFFHEPFINKSKFQLPMLLFSFFLPAFLISSAYTYLHQQKVFNLWLSAVKHCWGSRFSSYANKFAANYASVLDNIEHPTPAKVTIQWCQKVVCLRCHRFNA